MVIFCLVFTAPAKLEVELRAKIGHYRNRSLLLTSHSFMDRRHKMTICMHTVHIVCNASHLLSWRHWWHAPRPHGAAADTPWLPWQRRWRWRPWFAWTGWRSTILFLGRKPHLRCSPPPTVLSMYDIQWSKVHKYSSLVTRVRLNRVPKYKCTCT